MRIIIYNAQKKIGADKGSRQGDGVSVLCVWTITPSPCPPCLPCLLSELRRKYDIIENKAILQKAG